MTGAGTLLSVARKRVGASGLGLEFAARSSLEPRRGMPDPDLVIPLGGRP